MLTDEEKQACIQIVSDTIAFKLKLSQEMPTSPASPIFSEKYGVFVSLHRKGRLRGCIGYVQAYKTLYESLIDLSQAAAFRDNRFRPIIADEFDELEIEISILSPLSVVTDYEEIVVGRDGLVIQHPAGSGLLLPQVATQYGWDRETFLIETCHKAGLDESFLDDKDTTVYRFEAVVFGI